MNDAEIQSLISKKKYAEALQQCEVLLQENPDEKTEILRLKAHVYGLMGDYFTALQEREKILTSGEATIRDYYRAADNALYARELKKAVHLFNEVLEIGKRESEQWFETAVYLYLAYAHMELGDYKTALENINCAIQAEPDCAMPLPGTGMCSAEDLKNEIVKRTR